MPETTQSIRTMFENALMAWASYADLQNALLSPSALETALRNISGKPFTEELASYFVARFEALAHQPDTASGYSGTLFRRLGSDDFYFAQRGSDDFLDFALANAGIAVVGEALGQTDAMRDFWDSVVNGQEGLLTPAQRASLAEHGAFITGHSLGGHLAFRFSEMFPNAVRGGFTYNGAGLIIEDLRGHIGLSAASTRLLEFVHLLPGSLPNSLFSNFVSDYGFDMTSGANAVLGSTDRIFVEESVDPFEQHSIARQTKSLAAYYALQVLDPTFSMESTFKALKATSISGSDTLERVANALADAMGVTGSAGEDDGLPFFLTVIRDGEGSSPPAHISVKSLADLSADSIEAIASQDTETGRAARLALLKNYSVMAYGGSIDLSGRAELAVDQFSPEYLHYRSEYLSHALAANLENTLLSTPLGDEYAVSGRGMGYYAAEINGSQVVSRVASDLLTASLVSTGADQGISRHLFGGAAADNLLGGDADDFLFGGAGIDVLKGEAGNDLLDGGAGNDTLFTGTGNSVLVGGKDFDTYKINLGAGSSTVHDSDGQGALEIELSSGFVTLGSNLSALAGTTGLASDAYGNRYHLSGDQLTITTADGRTIDIEQYSAGELGITLPSSTPAVPPSAPGGARIANLPDSGDADPDSHPLHDIAVGDYGEASSGINSTDSGYSELIDLSAQTPGRAQWFLFGGMGDSYLKGTTSGANNIIHDDYFQDLGTLTVNPLGPNGVGNDVLEGGDEADVLVTHGGNDQSYGGAGSDVLIDRPDPEGQYGTVSWVNTAGHENQDQLRGEAGNDFILANAGNAVLDGGDGDDIVLGGAHSDTLIGGAGADVLSADTRQANNLAYYSPYQTGIELHFNEIAGETTYFGVDTLYGDAGNDQLIGGGGNDVLFGGADDDVLQGDFVSSPTGTFQFAGASVSIASMFTTHGTDPGAIQGNDRLYGEAGADFMVGGGGADLLDGGTGADILYGDLPTNVTQIDTSFHGKDRLLGGDGDDFLFGGGGDDYLDGGAGDDQLAGDMPTTSQTGNDEMHGGAGADLLRGQLGDDWLYGDAGNDTLGGDEGNDHVFGGDGDDLVEGHDGDDVLEGGAGNDTLMGDAGNDVLTPGAGGGANFGGAGDDTYVVNLGDGDQQISDDEGDNILRFGEGIRASDLIIRKGLETGTNNPLVYIYYSDSERVFLPSSSFQNLSRIEFADGSSLEGLELTRPFELPTSGLGDYQIHVAVSRSELSYAAVNDDLLIGYSGSVENWVNTADLDSKRVMYSLGDGSDYGLSATSVLVIHNWYQSEVFDYLREIIDPSFGTTALYGDWWEPNSIWNRPRNFVPTSGANVEVGEGGNDQLVGADANDILLGGAGDNTFTPGGGDDLLSADAGNDTYVIGANSGNDTISDGGGTDTLHFTGSIQSTDVVFHDTMLGLQAIIGPEANGNQILVLDWFDDPSRTIESWQFDGDSVTLDRAQVEAAIVGNRRPVLATPLSDQAYESGQPFTFTLPAGTFTDPNAGDTITLSARTGDGAALPDWLTFDAVTRTFSGVAPVTPASEFQLIVRATDSGGLSQSATFSLLQRLVQTGTAGNDMLLGGAGLDHLIGLAGNDQLDGGSGDDLLEGGDGDDSLRGDGGVFDVGNDVLYGGAGNDALGGGPGVDVLYGEDGDDSLQGTINAFINGEVVYGGGSAMYGGLGNDTYSVSTLDTVFEDADAGVDTIVNTSEASYTLGANFENLTMQVAIAGGVTGTGNAHDNVIVGQSLYSNHLLGLGGDDTLTVYGNAAVDVLEGGTGNDTYIVGNSTDVIVENAGEGIDSVQTDVSLTLAANVENLTLTGSGTTGTGNALDNTLTSQGGNNTLVGGAGNDVYVLTSVNDVVTEASGQGIDTIYTPWSYTLGNNVENLVYTPSEVNPSFLTGNALDNSITGSSADDTIDGGVGADQMIGGDGFDTYLVDNVNDVIIETASEDFDLVKSQVSYTLSANVEGLELEGSANLNATGNAINNSLYGNSGSNILDGMGGADYLEGGAGNDTYVIDDAGDQISEGSSGGTDTVQSAITWTLVNNLENLTLIGAATIDGTGNSGNNIITGNAASNALTGGSGNDTLDGGAGNDTLTGGQGNDTFVVDSTSDAVNESSGQGTDTVQSSVSWTLGSNLENLTLTGSANIDGTGNTLSNTVTGNSGNNVLDPGSAGTDVLQGGLGNDTYVVARSSGITITENSGEGTDLVNASVTYTLGNNLENLTLTGSTAINGTGNTLDNVLTGNSGNNTLTGSSGNDTLDPGSAGTDSLVGGQGNDTYVITRTSGITITENASEGTDLVNASVTYTLGSNLENLTLVGSANIDGTGNTLSNTITGNSGNNVLDPGSAGTDVLQGGLGNDTYVVARSSGITITENSGEGTDLVNASVTYTLGNNLENLTLTGSTAINGTGNTLDNVLTGNSGNNTLTGSSGNDTLDPGSAGTDTLQGGLGNDTYVVTRSTGITVTENSGEGTDLVNASVTYTLGNNLENLTLTGTSAINGTGNTLDNVLTGNSGNNTLTGSSGNDTLDPGSAGTDSLVGGQGNDTYTVNRSSGITTTESANEGLDTVNASVTATLASNIELLFQSGSSAINGTGNTLANLLRGNSGDNTLAGAGGTDILEGGGGNDTLSNTSGNTLLNGGAGTDTLTGTSNNDLLIGGAGNDALTTGSGADIIVFNKGEGQDTVAVSTTKDNTLAVGGGAVYADLLFQKSGNDLILKVGASDQITFTGFYASSSNHSVDKLQIVIEGTSDYDSGSGDALHNKKIETFNFDGLVAAFDAARAADPGLTTWALTNALLAQHLGGSDTAAVGGDLAYRYGRYGTLSDISFTPALGILAAAGFGTSAQSFQSLGSLQDSSARLS